MISTADWPQKPLDVIKDIRLDPRNVRLETTDDALEADIMADLFSNDNALRLVEGICKIGYLTHETPVVVERDESYVMVEGNRRLAALKAIQNPMLVPSFQARISKLSEGVDRRQLREIRVMVAPDQAAADELIATIHTTNVRERWAPARQAVFFQAQIDEGQTLADLEPRYPTIDVRKFVFRAHIVNAFRAVRYKDPELVDFLASKAWRKGLSTLARIFESTEFLELTGLKLTATGKLKMGISKRQFAAMAEIIVQGMKDGELNTRSLGTVEAPRFRQLMTELRRVVATDTATGGSPPTQATQSSSGKAAGQVAAPGPGRSTGGQPGTPAATGQVARTNSGGGQATAGASGPAARRKRSKSPTLDLSQIRVPTDYPDAVHSLLYELSAVSVQNLPNVTHLAMRAAVEKSIKAFADAKGEDIKATRNDHGQVRLNQALLWLLDYVKKHGPSDLRDPIESFRTGTLGAPYNGTSGSLNASNHNHLYQASSEDARAMWKTLEPIMRFLMTP